MKTNKIRSAIPPLFLLIGCLVFGGILLVSHLSSTKNSPPDETSANPSQTRILIAQIHKDEVQKIEFETEDWSPVLVLHDETWELRGDSDTPVCQSIVSALLKETQTLLALRKIGQSDELSQYGLEQPTLCIRLTDHHESYTLRFGKYVSSYNGYYLTFSDDPNVYIAEASLFDALFPDKESLLELPTLPNLALLQSLTLTLADGRTVAIAPENASSDESDLLNCITTLSVSHQVDYGFASDEAYGLNCAIQCDLLLSEQSSSSLRLFFGRGESNEYVYLRINTSHAVYVATSPYIDALLAYIDRNNSSDSQITTANQSNLDDTLPFD